MADSISMNPFQPGAGLLPGYMGRRPAIERPLLDIVDRLRAGQQGPGLAYLATFWSRGENLAVGLLPNGEAHAVLARPFLDAGLDASADVVAERARAQPTTIRTSCSFTAPRRGIP